MLFDKWYNITPKIYYKKRPRDSGRFVLLRRKKKKKADPIIFMKPTAKNSVGKGCFCVPLIWFFSLVPTDLSESGASASPLLGSTSDVIFLF
jgi:hypothetical protein